MKLLHVASLRLSLLASVVMALWSVLFYMVVMDEVNDETDDTLEDYAEVIMLRALRGEPLPKGSIGTNNQYFLHEVSENYAATQSHVRYEDRKVYIHEKQETEPARVFSQIYRTDDGRWMELEVSTPNIDKEDLKVAILLWLVVLYVSLIVVFFILNYWGMRRCMKPLYKLLQWLDNYRLGATNAPLDNNTVISEFRRLNEVVTRSTRRSEELHEQQRQFIGNASHEIQTPLAICQNRLEMMLDDDTLTEAQMGELLKVRHTLDHLSRLNRSLLLLCKIEGGQFLNHAPVDFAELLRRTLPDYEDFYGARQITTETRCEASAPRWEMDESLGSVLLTNLLKNAYVHNRPGGRVSIVMAEGRLSVANTGTTDEPLDEVAIFSRFYHTPGKSASTGLGLPIVRAICQRYGLQVSYRCEAGLHVFEVTAEKDR